MESKPVNIALCTLDSLDPDHGEKGIEVQLDGDTVSILLVRIDAQVYAYINRCPHTGVELNWLPDQFLDREHSFIQCATHDARFRIEDGFCVAGPCIGDSLKPLEVEIHNAKVYWKC